MLQGSVVGARIIQINGGSNLEEFIIENGIYVIVFEMNELGGSEVVVCCRVEQRGSLTRVGLWITSGAVNRGWSPTRVAICRDLAWVTQTLVNRDHTNSWFIHASFFA